MRTSSPSGAAVRPLQTPPISFLQQLRGGGGGGGGGRRRRRRKRRQEAAKAQEAAEAQEARVAARTLERAARPELSAVLKTRFPDSRSSEFPRHAASRRRMPLTSGSEVPARAEREFNSEEQHEPKGKQTTPT